MKNPGRDSAIKPTIGSLEVALIVAAVTLAGSVLTFLAGLGLIAVISLVTGLALEIVALLFDGRAWGD